jgi:hypothetical protein
VSAVQRPRGSKVRTEFERYLNSKKELRRLTQIRPFVYRVEMRGGTHVATLVDYYLLSTSDVLEIREADPEADAIVNVSQWNTNKPEARALANSEDVGLFDWKEFMGAVHHTGATFLAGGARGGNR